MRLLSEKLIEQILPLDLAIDSADEAFRAFSGKTAQIPPRSEIHRENPEGTALVMSGLIGNEVLGMKLVSSVRTSTQPPRKNTTCMMMIWDAADLRVRGLLAADRLNEHRTAAGLASATRRLAREGASTHLVVGAGKLAFTGALYISHVRRTKRLLLASRTRDKVVALAEKLRADPRMRGTDIVIDEDLGAAVAQADIITTLTTAEQPVFDGARVRPGTHINLGGAFRRHAREMDDGVAQRASFWLDSATACRERAGDIVQALATGALREERIRGELGELLLGKIPGRAGPDEITVFKSLGIASQDLVLGARLLDLAEKGNLGMVFDEKGGG
jgi:ornithine cyclodeaminase